MKCEKCGHKILAFPPECKCGGILEFNYINEFIESGDDKKATIVLSCTKCLKDYLTVGCSEDISELEECIEWYQEKIMENMGE